jgi:hypothetical protein
MTTKTPQGINLAKRKNAITVAKVAAGASILPLMTFSPPAYAIWQEVVRGIMTGIAEFTSQAFEKIIELWTDSQKDGDEKAKAAEAVAEDNRIDFRMQIENLKRINKVKPTTKLCEQESASSDHLKSVDENMKKQGRVPGMDALVVGNESHDSLNRGVAFFGVQNGKFDLVKAYENSAAAASKSARGEPLTVNEAIATNKLLTGNNAAVGLGQIRSVSKPNSTLHRSPQAKVVLNESLHIVAASSLSSKLIGDTMNVAENSAVAGNYPEKKAIERISKRYGDAQYEAELANELNEIALAAESVRLIGEHIYVLNAQFRQNQKIMALLAMKIITHRKGQE